jgi:hypothetical protein
VRFLLHDRLLAAWAGAFALGDAAFTVIFVGIPVLVVGHYGENPRLAGLLLGAWGGGAILGNVVSYRVRGIDLRLLAGVVLVQALPIWLLALPVPAAVLVAALAVSGLANGIVNPTIHSLFTLRPPPDIRPKVMTASFTASSIGGPAALLAAGPAFAAWGARPVYAVAAAAQTVAMLILGTTALRFRRTSGAAT